jgi:enoyl-CoA hydratase/carnithine racemase
MGIGKSGDKGQSASGPGRQFAGVAFTALLLLSRDRTREPVMSDIGTERRGAVALIELQRPPHNFFDTGLIEGIADALDALAEDKACRVVVLAAQGTSFCAGAALEGKAQGGAEPLQAASLYDQARRLFAFPKPVIAAVQGPAIGGGLGLAVACDFRIGCAETRLSANFTRLGFHPGFGLTVTLPRLIGAQAASLLFLTSRRVKGEEALRLGLLDDLVAREAVRARAIALAGEIAECGPLAVRSTRATLRLGLYEAVDERLRHELAEQARLQATDDHREGVAAMRDRRTPNFTGT